MKLQLKRSNVIESGSAKTPTSAQLEYGELAINYNQEDPAIFLKDSNNNVIRISGIGNIADDGQVELPASTTPPSNPLSGNLWFNSDEGRLYIYYTDSDTSQWVDASPDSWDPSSYPDVTDPTEQPNTLDDRYVSKVATTSQDVAGAITFEELTTHEVGVKVSGGTAETLKITSNGTGSITINDTNKAQHDDSTTTSVAHALVTTRLDNTGASAIAARALINLNYQNRNRVVGFQSLTNNDIRSTQFDLFSAEVTTPQTKANSVLTGFRSVINTSDHTGTNAETYNFFAEGDAPSYFNGNVGIGTTDPDAKLHISEPVGTSTPARMIFTNQGIRGVTVGFDTVGVAGVTSPNFSISNGDQSVNYLNINATGNVGIGTDSPLQTLDVFGTEPSNQLRLMRKAATGDVQTAGIVFGNDFSTNGLGILGAAGSGFQFRTTTDTSATNPLSSSISNTLVKIDETGNVGIGTTDPDTKLHVVGTILTENILYSANQDQPYLIAGTTNYTGANTSWGTYGFQHRFKSNSVGTGRVTIDTSQGEAFCVNNSGRVGIGTDNPVVELDVDGSIRTKTGISFDTATPSSANTLDDYEEGTWIPTFLSQNTTGGSITYSTTSNRKGSYIRVGRQVTLQCALGWSANTITGGSDCKITGLPFPIGSPSQYGRSGGCTGYDNTDLPSGAQIQFRDGGTGIIVGYKTTSTVTANIALKDIGNNGLLIFSYTYFVNP